MKKHAEVSTPLCLPLLLSAVILIFPALQPSAGGMTVPLPDHKPPIVIYQKKTPLDQPLEEILPININSADAATLMKVPGINRTAARQIVNQRDREGKYTDLEQLVGFSGISRHNIPQLRDYLVVE